MTFESMPKQLWIPLFAIILMVFTLVVVPRKEFRGLFPTALFWGGVLSILLNGSMRLLKVLEYNSVGPFIVFRVPFWFILAWPMSVILFLFFRPKKQIPYLLYLFIFCLLSVGIDAFFHNLKVLKHVSWYPYFRFFDSIVFFEGSRIIYERLMKEDEEEKSKREG